VFAGPLASSESLLHLIALLRAGSPTLALAVAVAVVTRASATAATASSATAAKQRYCYAATATQLLLRKEWGTTLALPFTNFTCGTPSP